MGLLSQGSPLSWEETQRHAEHVRKHGILQFLHIYRAVGERHKDVLKWGDEVSGNGSQKRMFGGEVASVGGEIDCCFALSPFLWFKFANALLLFDTLGR